MLLGGAAANPPAAWRAELRLEPLPALPVAEPKLPWLTAERPVPRGLLSLVVTSAGRTEPVLQAQAELALQGEFPRWGPPQILPGVQTQIEETVRGWAQRLDEQLACEPVNVQVLQVSGSRLKVDQGALAGLRPGEEWLVADRRLLPQRVLEPDATSQLVLARIDKVSPLQAELEVLAGPASRVQPRWQAWPMQAP